MNIYILNVIGTFKINYANTQKQVIFKLKQIN